MFQTEINHFFQAFETVWLTAFMRLITGLGYGGFYIVLLSILIFGVNFRKGFVLMQILLWTAVLTVFFKDYFALPRPFHVDSTLALLDGQLPDASLVIYEKGGAKGFFDPLPSEVVQYYREAEGVAYGFPSGHTSITVALWGAIFVLFSSLWLRYLSLALILLIPFSRIYLGVHFLADVLGGYVLGLVVWTAFQAVILRPARWKTFEEQAKIAIDRSKILPFLFLFLAPFGMLLILPAEAYDLAAYLLGLNLGFLVVGQRGIPEDEAVLWKRIARVLVAFALFALLSLTSRQLLLLSGLAENALANFILTTLSVFLFIWGGATLNQRFGWWGKQEN